MSKKLCFLIALVFAISAAFASPAMADNTPIPGTMTATSSAYETGMATKMIGVKTWIAVQEHIRVQKKSQVKCQWFATFWNSNYVLGQIGYKPQMYIDHNGYLCRDKFSPSGWEKEGGGHTGSPCHNISAPFESEMPHYKVVAPPSMELKYNTTVNVWVNVTVHAAAKVQLWCGMASGNGTASDKVKVSYAAYIMAKGTAAKVKLFLSIAIKASDYAKANARVSCSYTPPTQQPPPPPQVCTDMNATNFGSPPPCQYAPPPPGQPNKAHITCTGFEEITGGGSFLVDCAVSDDNGAPIYLSATPNDANSRVSGINCISNGGSQTCPSGGTFEFRVTGINNGSTVLSSSITATASASGDQDAVFNSGQFPVDPSGGGF